MESSIKIKNNFYKLWNIPNSLTASRILAIPFFIAANSDEQLSLGLVLIIWTLLSDFFDGRLARRLNQTTTFGAIFDPVADKIVGLFYLSYFYSLEFLPLWYLALVWVRDIAQLASIPVLSWWLKRAFKVKPKLYGKWGTAIPLFLILTCQLKLMFENSNIWNFYFIELLIVVSSFFEILILVTYIPRFIAIAKGRHDTFE